MVSNFLKKKYLMNYFGIRIGPRSSQSHHRFWVDEETSLCDDDDAMVRQYDDDGAMTR